MSAIQWSQLPNLPQIQQEKDERAGLTPQLFDEAPQARFLSNRLISLIGGAAAATAAIAYWVLFGRGDLIAKELKADQISTLTDLGGVPVKTFEKLAGGLGLLVAGDHLKTVLHRDWTTIGILDTTHIVLASMLQELLEAAKSGKTQLLYNPSKWLGKKLSPQLLNIDYREDSSCKVDDPFSTIPKTWATPSCRQVLTILNSKDERSVEIRNGMIDLIDKFGFYGNGEARVDPIQTLATLTGQDISALQQRVDARLSVSTAIANFANDLSIRLSAQHPNESFAHSPTSIIAALGMALPMIEPDQRDQFLQTIGLGHLTEDEAHEAIAASLQAMIFPKDFKQGTMEVAQGIALKEKIRVSDSMSRLMKETYRADVIVSNDLSTAVNQWVSLKTHDKIPNILPNNDSDFVLLNAVYLAFKWKDPFEKPRKGWRVEDFTCADGTKAKVSMMKQEETCLVYRGKTFDFLEKPYISPSGRSLSQLIFLPHDPKQLSLMEQGLTDEAIRGFRQEAKLQEVKLSMPKVKMESEFHLLDLLKEMGLPLDAIDQSVIVGFDTKITDVIHKTFVSTDEEGTEAAAVTAIGFECSAALPPPPPPEFRIDHSYSYFIMDGDTVLFRGRVADRAPLVVD